VCVWGGGGGGGVPKLHMTDSGGAEPKASKFKPGKKLAARWVVNGPQYVCASDLCDPSPCRVVACVVSPACWWTGDGS
jgi:hypothetical protein